MMNRREFLASILKLSAALPALAVLPFVGKTAAATAYTLSGWFKRDGSPWQYVSVVGDGTNHLTLYIDGQEVVAYKSQYELRVAAERQGDMILRHFKDRVRHPRQ